MKIFVSYRRRDAGDFAEHIHEYLKDKHDIFTDVNDIRAGDIWSNTIEDNISACNIFIIIVTYGALDSQEVEKEVLQAQRENKKIIPCFHKDVESNDIKWGLGNYQGIKFDEKYDLARQLYSRVKDMTSLVSPSERQEIRKSPSPYDVYENIALIHQATEIKSSDLTPEQKQRRTPWYSIKVWIDEPNEILNQIDKVIYSPQPSRYFPDGGTTSTSVNKRFAVYWTVWGEFNLKVTIYFKKGSVKELSRYINFS
jgi:hypothetical protein